MVDTLIHAYTPLIFWVGLGIITLRWLPTDLPRWLGRALYWVGVPWQIFALARTTDLSGRIGDVPVITIATLGFGIVLAWSTVKLLTWLAQRQANRATLNSTDTALTVAESPPQPVLQGAAVSSDSLPIAARSEPLDTVAAILPQPANGWLHIYDRHQQGSFILAGMLGNTGFVGLGLLPTLISPENMKWAVFFSLTQNLIGTYTIGVLIASHFGGTAAPSRIWALVRNVLLVPSLWAFAAGFWSRSVSFPQPLDDLAQAWYVWVIPASFILMGMRLRQLEGWSSIQRSVAPVVLKVLLLPAFVGLGTTLIGLTGEPRLALVMMAGMPCAFAGLILAEEYDLDHDLAASSIALSTVGLLVMIPIWLGLLS
jgi:malate permease and related proteins